jgi:Rrf2 family transcriptional regulator, cysteine metabolism repressor
MKLSLKVEYACRVLTQLAKSYPQQELPHIEELAQAEAIPANYLVQILNELRNSGLIRSRRGKQGGYILARPPASISVGEIVRAIDGEILGFTETNPGESGAAVSVVWRTIAATFEEKCDSYTLEDMMPAGDGGMYHI